MLNQVCWISLQPAAKAVDNAYGISGAELASIGLIYMAIFVPINFPANYALNKGGLVLGINFGTVMTVIGMWIKCLINKSFAYVYIG